MPMHSEAPQGMG